MNGLAIESSKITKASALAAIRRQMRKWPLYDRTEQITAVRIRDDWWSLGYGQGLWYRRDMTFWEANTIKGVFYLLHIRVAPDDRGKGHGAAMYELIESIARDLGCTDIRQHPSGNTMTGETRRDYLLRRGWQDGGVEVFKKL